MKERLDDMKEEPNNGEKGGINGSGVPTAVGFWGVGSGYATIEDELCSDHYHAVRMRLAFRKLMKGLGMKEAQWVRENYKNKSVFWYDEELDVWITGSMKREVDTVESSYEADRAKIDDLKKEIVDICKASIHCSPSAVRDIIVREKFGAPLDANFLGVLMDGLCNDGVLSRAEGPPGHYVYQYVRTEKQEGKDENPYIIDRHKKGIGFIDKRVLDVPMDGFNGLVNIRLNNIMEQICGDNFDKRSAFETHIGNVAENGWDLTTVHNYNFKWDNINGCWHFIPKGVRHLDDLSDDLIKEIQEYNQEKNEVAKEIDDELKDMFEGVIDESQQYEDWRKNFALEGINSMIKNTLNDSDRGKVSDGYHTFDELYEIRKAYNAALFNEWSKTRQYQVHKSWKHNDGELCFGGGWFIVVALLPGGQISNHYKAEDWKLFKVPAFEIAKYAFDGHTTADVIERLGDL